MTTEIPTLVLPSVRATEARILIGVSAAHFLSHFYFLLLPPVFAQVRGDYGVSYTELGIALAAFNVISAIFQTPAGILADRIGPYAVLVAGLALEAVAFGLVGFVDSYWFLVAMFGVAGLANTVFHPADYALLSHHIDKSRVGRAFSIHTFAGMLGSAAAPATIAWFLFPLVGWRGVFIASAIAGLAVTALLVLGRDDYAHGPHLARRADANAPSGTDWAILKSGPILRSFGFFTALAAVSVGIQNYSVVALGAAFDTPIDIANGALTTSLAFTAVGVLVGGMIVGRLGNHGGFAAVGIAVTGVMILLVGLVDLGALALLLVMSISGFASGIIMPSRDMIVRQVTPPGSFGTVFGFVTSGFNVAGVAFPLVFGALMDHGSPRAVFYLSAACCILSIATVITIRRRPRDLVAAR
jgi:FSR family fosmidomycin resistance protein-like MFS transporter